VTLVCAKAAPDIDSTAAAIRVFFIASLSKV
jgi:hypothetical protein